MIQYIYFVKCPNCDDEPFDFFDEAKEYAISCLGDKPIITQIEVDRNDFGECVDSNDLGTVWSWENVVGETEDEPAVSVFTKDDLVDYVPDEDPEFAALDNSLDNIPDNFDPHPVTVAEPSVLKELPADMSVDALVEEMEENEDAVECKWCNELFDKSEVRYEVDMGYLCDRCAEAIKSRGETLTFREGPLEEAMTFRPKEKVELHYDKLTVSVVTKVIPATYWEPADYIEEDHTGEFDYEVDADDVATAIWENFLTEEYVADVEGGFDTLEEEKHWLMYLETHFDDLVEKYYDQLLKYYEDDAAEAAQEKFQNDYDDYEPDYYDEGLKTELSGTKSVLEDLEDGETYRKRLTTCPECGTDSYDPETRICINCGFN
jgi:ribosomal protein L37E